VATRPARRHVPDTNRPDGGSSGSRGRTVSPLLALTRYNFLYPSSSVLRAAAARPSSAADPAAGPPASARSRPHGLAGRSGARRPISASPVKIDLALRAPRARRQGASRCSATFGIVGQGVEHPGRAVTGNPSYAKLRIQARQQVISSRYCAPRGRLHAGASQPEVEITEGGPDGGDLTLPCCRACKGIQSCGSAPCPSQVVHHQPGVDPGWPARTRGRNQNGSTAASTARAGEA
jgi:hypothetical protein